MTRSWMGATFVALAAWGGAANAIAVNYNISGALGYGQTYEATCDGGGSCNETIVDHATGSFDATVAIDTARLGTQGGDPAYVFGPSTYYTSAGVGGAPSFGSGSIVLTGSDIDATYTATAGDPFGGNSSYLYGYVDPGGGLSPMQINIASGFSLDEYDPETGLLVRQIYQQESIFAFLTGVTMFQPVAGVDLPVFGSDTANSSFDYNFRRIEYLFEGGNYVGQRYYQRYFGGAEIQFSADYSGGTAVPEPAALALFGFAAMALACRRRAAR